MNGAEIDSAPVILFNILIAAKHFLFIMRKFIAYYLFSAVITYSVI